jgi:hypothetical protein
MSDPKSLPWRGEKKGRLEGGHPVERGRKKMAPGDGDSFRPLFLLVPAKAGILLPLEKELRTLAFALDPTIKRLGPEPSAAARAARRRERSERVPVGAAFSVPFWAGQKRDIPAGDTSRMAAERQEFVYVFYRTTW